MALVHSKSYGRGVGGVTEDGDENKKQSRDGTHVCEIGLDNILIVLMLYGSVCRGRES